MKLTTYDFAETGLNVAGIAISVQDLNQILNLILLIISVSSILIRVCMKIYDLVKARRFKEIEETLNEAKDEINEVKNKLEDTDEGNRRGD